MTNETAEIVDAPEAPGVPMSLTIYASSRNQPYECFEANPAKRAIIALINEMVLLATHQGEEATAAGWYALHTEIYAMHEDAEAKRQQYPRPFPKPFRSVATQTLSWWDAPFTALAQNQHRLYCLVEQADQIAQELLQLVMKWETMNIGMRGMPSIRLVAPELAAQRASLLVVVCHASTAYSVALKESHTIALRRESARQAQRVARGNVKVFATEAYAKGYLHGLDTPAQRAKLQVARDTAKTTVTMLSRLAREAVENNQLALIGLQALWVAYGDAQQALTAFDRQHPTT